MCNDGKEKSMGIIVECWELNKKKQGMMSVGMKLERMVQRSMKEQAKNHSMKSSEWSFVVQAIFI